MDSWTIPACAGEPGPENVPDEGIYSWTIPACAGEPTHSESSRQLQIPGLSPRVRGNHVRLYRTTEAHSIGTIPACAGEPRGLVCIGQGRGQRDYPRVCGEPAHWGLLGDQRPCQRTIPACAGEPSCVDCAPYSPPLGLSPRVRGNRGRGIPQNSEPSIGLSPRVRGNPDFDAKSATHYRTIPACAEGTYARARVGLGG